jgi:hypothetical protein
VSARVSPVVLRSPHSRSLPPLAPTASPAHRLAGLGSTPRWPTVPAEDAPASPRRRPWASKPSVPPVVLQVRLWDARFAQPCCVPWRPCLPCLPPISVPTSTRISSAPGCPTFSPTRSRACQRPCELAWPVFFPLACSGSTVLVAKSPCQRGHNRPRRARRSHQRHRQHRRTNPRRHNPCDLSCALTLRPGLEFLETIAIGPNIRPK